MRSGCSWRPSALGRGRSALRRRGADLSRRSSGMRTRRRPGRTDDGYVHGLIETVGDVVAVEQRPGAVRLFVRRGFRRQPDAGESIAVNGVCLTVVEAGGRAAASTSAPRHARHDPGELRARATREPRAPDAGRPALRRALRAGHVDAVGTIVDIRPEGESWWLRVALPDALAPLFVPKGSMAMDGISLTVAALARRFFDVQIIPFTWSHTNLRAARAGDARESRVRHHREVRAARRGRRHGV